jgi:sulfide:quinone oxidoreductase
MRPKTDFDIVIVGGGAGGIAVASSIVKRNDSLRVAVVDPSQTHYYQPGWTMVGAGVFDPRVTVKTMASLIPCGVDWLQAEVERFEPDADEVVLRGERRIGYQHLIVAPGLKLDWDAIEGLSESIGHYGVTSNYRFDLAPYTWRLVSQTRAGRAIFTQPPMPIKCAGAPQKAMYLSANFWEKAGCLQDIDIEFCNAGAVLFGVEHYVPALMKYVERYDATLSFQHNLKRVDGPARTAWFDRTDSEGNVTTVEREFDFMHVCPPQTAPDFIRNSPLADDAGWVDVDQTTLNHKRYANVWALGDVINAPNAKTAAAARAQAPVVAQNVLHGFDAKVGVLHYNGYGSCPLTVERGKIVLAEFGYGGKLLPSFPRWFIDGARPSRLAWLLKEKILPPIYWQAMLKGREWMISKDTGEPIENAS